MPFWCVWQKVLNLWKISGKQPAIRPSTQPSKIQHAGNAWQTKATQCKGVPCSSSCWWILIQLKIDPAPRSSNSKYLGCSNLSSPHMASLEQQSNQPTAHQPPQHQLPTTNHQPPQQQAHTQLPTTNHQAAHIQPPSSKPTYKHHSSPAALVHAPLECFMGTTHRALAHELAQAHQSKFVSF